MTDSKPSKSERKRQQQALQQLGERLIELSDDELASVALDDALRKAVREAKTIKSYSALRRQKQLIGKLIRRVDPEPIRAAIARLSADDLRAKQLFARAERWRDRLVREAGTGLDAFEAESGHRDEELRRMLGELANTIDERAEKTLRRQIFRRVHAILVTAADAS